MLESLSLALSGFAVPVLSWLTALIALDLFLFVAALLCLCLMMIVPSHSSVTSIALADLSAAAKGSKPSPISPYHHPTQTIETFTVDWRERWCRDDAAGYHVRGNDK